MICFTKSKVETALAVEISTCLHVEMVVKHNTAHEFHSVWQSLGHPLLTFQKHFNSTMWSIGRDRETVTVDVEAALAMHHVIFKSNQIERMQTMQLCRLCCKIRGIHVLAIGEHKQESETIVQIKSGY